jgi:secernin
MVVALARATVNGCTHFGHNCSRPRGEGQALARVPGRGFAPGETVQTTSLTIPQVRHTNTVLAGRCPGLWGYQQGVNEHGVTIGVTSIRTRLKNDQPGLTGTDLVRLALERAASARQAVDVVTDLIGRHGQSGFSAGAGEDAFDSSFLLADCREAFALEVCGSHWALQAIQEVRAASDRCHLRQDWDRISRGLSDLVISRGWWPENGSKVDFAGSLAVEGDGGAAGLRRWGRATLLLEQQNGQIDAPFLRRLLSDHAQPAAAPRVGRPHLRAASAPSAEAVGAPDPSAATGSLCQHATGSAAVTATSLIAQLGEPPGHLPFVWWAFGTPCLSVYFPVFFDGDLPAAFQPDEATGCLLWRQATRLQADRRQQQALRQALFGLQEKFDEETRVFLSEATVLKHGGAAEELKRLTESFMQHNLEGWSGLYDEFCRPEDRPAPVRSVSEPFYSVFPG